MNKKRYMRYFTFGLLVSFFIAGQALAGVAPVFNLYETLENTQAGTASEIGPVVDLSAGLTGVPFTGEINTYAVLTETSNTSNHQLSNWSDVLHFQFVGLQDDGIGLLQLPFSATVQLFSDPAFNPLPVNDIVNGTIGALWIAETTPPTNFSFFQFNASNALIFAGTFNVYSDAPGDREVPEPSTFLLLGAGLAGIGLLRRRFKK